MGDSSDVTVTAQSNEGGRRSLLALLRWVLGSWLRPPDEPAGWEQAEGHRLGLRSGTGGSRRGGGEPQDETSQQTTWATPQGQ